MVRYTPLALPLTFDSRGIQTQSYPAPPSELQTSNLGFHKYQYFTCKHIGCRNCSEKYYFGLLIRDQANDTCTFYIWQIPILLYTFISNTGNGHPIVDYHFIYGTHGKSYDSMVNSKCSVYWYFSDNVHFLPT